MEDGANRDQMSEKLKKLVWMVGNFERELEQFYPMRVGSLAVHNVPLDVVINVHRAELDFIQETPSKSTRPYACFIIDGIEVYVSDLTPKDIKRIREEFASSFKIMVLLEIDPIYCLLERDKVIPFLENEARKKALESLRRDLLAVRLLMHDNRYKVHLTSLVILEDDEQEPRRFSRQEVIESVSSLDLAGKRVAVEGEVVLEGGQHATGRGH